VAEADLPSTERLLELLHQARDSIIESQKHWEPSNISRAIAATSIAIKSC
jgi:hypothetical protein